MQYAIMVPQYGYYLMRNTWGTFAFDSRFIPSSPYRFLYPHSLSISEEKMWCLYKMLKFYV